MAKCSQCGRSMPAFSLQKKCSWCMQYEAQQRGEDTGEVQHVMVNPWERSATEQTPVTLAILAINILVYVMMIANGVDGSSPSAQDLVRWGANFGPYTMSGQWWRLISHAFLHIGYFHLAMNMWCLWSVGTECEREIGSLSFAGMYLVSAVAGGLGSLLWHPYTTTAGASGAIFGIFGCLIAIYKFGSSSMSGLAARASARNLIQWAAICLVISLFTNADNAAHVGGLIAGLVLGTLFSVVAPDSSSYGRRAVSVLMVATALAGGLYWTRDHGGLRSDNRPHYAELLRQGRTDEAIAEMKTLLQKDPGNAEIRLRLAHAYQRKDDQAAALEQFLWVVAHRPAEDSMRNSAEYGVEEIYVKQQRYADAQQFFSNLIKSDPKDYSAHYSLAEIAAAQEHHEDAAAEFQKVTELLPNDPAAFGDLGRTYAKLKRYDDSVTAYKKAIELSDPEDDDIDQLRSELAQVENLRGPSAPAKSTSK